MHGLRWFPGSPRLLGKPADQFLPGYNCTSIESNSPLENASSRKGAMALLKARLLPMATILLTIHSVAYSRHQRRSLGELSSDQRDHSKPGPIPQTLFIHVSVLHSFWTAATAGPRLFVRGLRRREYWKDHPFTTLEELKEHNPFVPSQPALKRQRIGDGKHFFRHPVEKTHALTFAYYQPPP